MRVMRAQALLCEMAAHHSAVQAHAFEEPMVNMEHQIKIRWKLAGRWPHASGIRGPNLASHNRQHATRKRHTITPKAASRAVKPCCLRAQAGLPKLTHSACVPLRR